MNGGAPDRTDAQLRELRRLAADERRADEAGDTPRAVRLSGEFHQALARMHGNPVLARLLDPLLPTTSVRMSRFAATGQPVRVAHRHVDLVDALECGGAAAALEMKRHLAELQESLTRPQARVPPSLRDVFAAYREGNDVNVGKRPAGSLASGRVAPPGPAPRHAVAARRAEPPPWRARASGAESLPLISRLASRNVT